jgi:hypothetical protein
LDIAFIHQKSGFLVKNDFRNTRVAGRDNRESHRTRLENGNGRAFAVAIACLDRMLHKGSGSSHFFEYYLLRLRSQERHSLTDTQSPG